MALIAQPTEPRPRDRSHVRLVGRGAFIGDSFSRATSGETFEGIGPGDEQTHPHSVTGVRHRGRLGGWCGTEDVRSVVGAPRESGRPVRLARSVGPSGQQETPRQGGEVPRADVRQRVHHMISGARSEDQSLAEGNCVAPAVFANAPSLPVLFSVAIVFASSYLVSHGRQSAESGSIGCVHQQFISIPGWNCVEIPKFFSIAGTVPACGPGGCGLPRMTITRGEEFVEDIDLNRKTEIIGDAERGDDNAQFMLGRMYLEAHGVPQDYRKALKWLRLSADQGNSHAQFDLGPG